MLTIRRERGIRVGRGRSDGAATSFEWDVCGRLVGVTDPFGARWRYAYDGSGRLTTVIDALGRTTRYGRVPERLPLRL